jgi:DNA polymerase Ligase (LigD)
VPRFVVLTHDHPHPHWDLMLEAGGRLRTWRLERPPMAGESVAAQAIGDHRTAYLDYEGPVSGGRGTVARWDAGTYAVESEEEGRLRLRLEGGRLSGPAELRRDGGDRWTLVVG